MQKLALASVVFIAAGIAAAQPVSIGVLGGVPFVDQTQNHDESRRYIVGPSVEVKLPAGFALEADALYQRIGDRFNYQLLTGASLSAGMAQLPVGAFTALTNRQRANMWEFPLLGKYYFRRDSAWQPFFGTGWALRFADVHEAGSSTQVSSNGNTQVLPFHDDFRTALGVGATFAAGLRYRRGHVAFTPEIRYTRWSVSGDMLRKDEAGFLLGIWF